MVSVIVKAALLLYFFHLVAHVTGQSSCIPNFFRYIHNETSDDTTGRIEMWGSPKGVPLQLSAALSIATALPTVSETAASPLIILSHLSIDIFQLIRRVAFLFNGDMRTVFFI